MAELLVHLYVWASSRNNNQVLFLYLIRFLISTRPVVPAFIRPRSAKAQPAYSTFARPLSPTFLPVNKMGQTPSTPLPSALPSYALHCLRVADSSPSAGLLEPFFDYLIGVDTPVPLPPVAGGPGSFDGEDGELGLTPLDLGRILDRCEGQEIGLRVYNAKSQRVRGGCPPFFGEEQPPVPNTG